MHPGRSTAIALALALAAVALEPPPLRAEPPVAPPPGMAAVGPGAWRPLYASATDAPATEVPRFFLDTRPVTNAEFLAFVTREVRWRRDRIPELFADGEYLAHWASALSLGDGASARAPVTNVSWFAAEAYCAAQGARLPTEAEWELAAMASPGAKDARDDAAFTEKILAWYATPGETLAEVGRGEANAWGVQDLHGLVWEWVRDFHDDLVGGDSRAKGERPEDAFCGAGAGRASDARDYAGFMRAAFRSALEGRYTGRRLGFRCAREPAARGTRAPEATARAYPGASVYQLAGPFTDAGGAEVALDVFAGSPVLIAMFYASCRSACPVLIERVRRIEEALSEPVRARVRVVLVTLDPERDTPKVLAALGARHGLDPGRWRLLAGSEPTTRALATVLGVRYRRGRDDEITHSTSVSLLDARGVARSRAEGLWAPYDALIAALRELTAEPAHR